jgi:hypothetical protein
MVNAALLADAVLEGTSPRDFLKGLPAYRRFRLTFDFGAGEDGYSLYVNVGKDLLAGLRDDALMDKVMEYAKETQKTVDRDDWDWLVDVEEVPVVGEAKSPREFIKGLPTRKLLTVGQSVSHATLNPRDLINAFLDALEQRAPLDYAKLVSDPEINEYLENPAEARDQNFEDNLLHEVLWDEMQGLCPPMTYFGSHPGNGSDFGCWPYESHDYEDLAAEEKVVYAKEDDVELAQEIRSGGLNGGHIPYGIVQTDYMSFECYDSGGRLLWQT